MLIIKNRIQEHLLLVQNTTKAIMGMLVWGLATLATTLTDTCVQVKNILIHKSGSDLVLTATFGMQAKEC